MPNGGFDDLPDSLIAKQLADLMVKDNTDSNAGNLKFDPITSNMYKMLINFFGYNQQTNDGLYNPTCTVITFALIIIQTFLLTMLVDSQKSAKCSAIDKTASQGKTESPEAECSTTEIQTKQNEEVKQATVQPSQTNKNSLNGEYDSTQHQASMSYRVPSG